MAKTSTDVIVLGAGAIGTAVAWRCAQRGLRVSVVDPEPERGAWRTAAGMLAPITELHYAESALLHLNLDSLARYRQFVAELTESTGRPTGFYECGTVFVAWDGADLAGLRDLAEFGRGLGLDSRMLTGRELHALEPAVASGLPGALLAEADHQVDPRLLHAALHAACVLAGVEFVQDVPHVDVSGERVVGVSLAGGRSITAGHVVLAAGSWSGRVDGLPPVAVPAVRPVKGQTLRLWLPGPPRLSHVVRGRVKGSAIYVLPRGSASAVSAAGCEYIVGASSEEVGFDLEPRAGAVYELLRDAQSVVPELGEAVLAEIRTGLRPGSPDNAPLIGPSGIDGLIHATGHFRNGILLAPVTADAIADLVTTGTLPDVVAPFTPARLRPEVRA